MTHDESKEWARSEGVRPSRMYDLGFPHDNCAGTCVKAGFAQFKHLLNVLPERFAWLEDQEQVAQNAIGTSSTVLTRPASRKRKARNITLKEFRETIQSEPRLFDSHGWGCGGGCAVDDGEEQEPTT